MNSRGTPRDRFASRLPILLLPLAAASLDARARGHGERGPGGNPALVSTLALPVERTFDLDHVQPGPFAVALGNDPERIFTFVRDAVAFESYRGALRGPRGTLLALAGNATDRALLLASMLEASRQQVRFAHGTLPEPLAFELVSSMWTEPLSPALGADSPGFPRAPDRFETSVRSNYTRIRDELEHAGIAAGSEAGTDASTLVREAQDHVWVQWRRGDEWIDLDPSFADARVGRRIAPVDETWDVFPESRHHRIELRVVIEEQAGDKVSAREVLHLASRACDLSGGDLVLSHQPENWAGPASSVEAALSAAILDSGRIKPVVIINRGESVMGEPFFQRPPPSRGLGGIGSALRGAGGRKDVAIAIAGRVDLSLIAPDGRRVEVTRELFDLLGPARRLRNERITTEEALARAGTGDGFDATAAAWDLFVTTGRIAALHLEGANAAKSSDGDIAACLKRMSLSFAIVSDALLEGLRAEGIRAYPDLPRVFITDVSGIETAPRLSLDLRHDGARVVTRDSSPKRAFHARLLRGVVDGVLEQVLFADLITAAGGEEPANAPARPSALSTTLLFELAEQNAIPLRLVTSVDGLAALELEADARARLHREIAAGFLTLVPERTVRLSERPRSAWWRIDARSGDVVAVTDEGLHQVVTERRITEDQKTRHVTIVERRWFVERGGARSFLGQREFTLSPDAYKGWVDRMLAKGIPYRNLIPNA